MGILMRQFRWSVLLVVGNAALAFGQEHQAPAGGGGLMSLQANLMFWTLIIFGILYFLLSRYAFGPITAAVDAREKALEELIEGARRDREAAAKVLADQLAATEAALGERQKLIAEGRAISEKMRQDLLEQTRKEQQDMLARAKREIETEKEKAVAQLRREAVDL